MDARRHKANLPSDRSGPAADPLQAEIERLKRDLIQAERQIAELEARADIDPLLEILNRRGFERELKRSLAYVARYGTEAALVFIDLDGFKAVNDRHGHSAGDALLKGVACQLTGHVRASDVVGRMGGDEFAVVIWNVGEEKASAKAHELERLIEQVEIAHGAGRISVGASAGIALLKPELNPVEVLDTADRAMYARKKERRKG
jgi:diguanylate cyclase (GGDEF)-like protein